MEDGCNVTVTALRNTRRCVALFRPRATCTNLMVTCDKFYLPNEDEARCRQVAGGQLWSRDLCLHSCLGTVLCILDGGWAARDYCGDWVGLKRIQGKLLKNKIIYLNYLYSHGKYRSSNN